MVVNMVVESEKTEENWVCKNCGFRFRGIDEDRPSGRMGLCPECYLHEEE